MTEYNPSKYKLLDGHRVQLAFELDGMKYWEFYDSKMAPCGRMFAAMDFYSEFEMRMDRAFLIATFKAMRENLNGKNGQIDFMAVSKLVLQAEERLQSIFEPDTAYKYASVIFFDETEDPYSYDFKYGREKIARWKKHTPESFFLSMPVKRLFPLSDISKTDFQRYLKTLGAVNREHLETIFTMLSSNNSTSEWYKELLLQTQSE